ncbi:MAG: glycosyltransferase family 4 protein, partial [Rhodothermales bacterium]|nr:glycosyltransferase family 4 protein [Rhodothermales bacterium]
MNIVYLARTRIPSRQANSINVMKMCQAFARNGHDVVLMNSAYPDVEPGVDDVYGFYGVSRCFRTLSIPEQSRFTDRQAFVDHVHHTVHAEAPAVVFARDHSLPYELGRLGLPVVLDAHKAVSDARMAERLGALLDSGRLVRFVTVTDALRVEYESAFPDLRGCTLVAANGADEPAGVLPTPLPPTGRFPVGYVGHLYPGKGMEVVAALAQRCPWADFHVVGGTDEDLAFWSAELLGPPNVHLHGFRPPSEVPSFLQAMEVLLVPNQRSVQTAGASGTDVGQWTSPLKVAEAMAAGKAILASDLPVLREALSPGRTAVLCPPDDVSAWAERLAFLRDHPEERAALGRRARAEFRAHRTWRARAERVLAGIGV